MKLSEAMRLGAMMGPQIKEDYLSTLTGGSCAIGAAFMAIGRGDIVSSPDAYIVRADIFPSLGMELYWKLDAENSVDDRIILLNDKLGWTREQIADYIVAKGYDCEAVLDAVTTLVIEAVPVNV